ncbi:MAG TPA: MFS transporter [Gammaproteobacteria bacterium]|nr:MFS transporter [Gammaproteobacteria bacterium]
MVTNQLNLLKEQRFLPLFFTQFLGAFNDNVYKNSLVILITYNFADSLKLNSEILITIAAGVFIFPFFLFSATAGQLADKFEKTKLIRYTKIAEIFLMLLAAIGLYFQSILLLMTVLFLVGTQAAFFGPLKYSILPDQLQSNELLAGNALIEAGTFLAILLGTILGGILASLQAAPLLISFAIVLAAAVGYAASRFIPPAKIAAPHIKIRWNIFIETKEIIFRTMKHRELALAILGISWFWLVGATYLSQFPTYAKVILGAGPTVVTLFLTCFSFGIGAGSLFCNRLLKGKIRATYVPIAAIGMVIFGTDLVLASEYVSPASKHLLTLAEFLNHLQSWRLLLDLFLLAACGGIYAVPLYAILQYKSEAEYRSRVIACNNIMNALFMVLAASLTSVMLALHFSVTHVFILIALANAVAAFFLRRLSVG